MVNIQSLASLACFLGSFLLLITLTLAMAIRIVPEHRWMAVYRLGRYLGEKGPGLVLLIPFIDRGIMVDVRDEMAKAQAYREVFGVVGETQTHVHDEGSVTVDGNLWHAVSRESLPPGVRVRVTRVILEVESI